MGTFHKKPTIVNGWHVHENTFAEGTVWDSEENEWSVTVYGFCEFEPANKHGLPEDYDEGYHHTEVLRVRCHTPGGGQYNKEFDTFPPETQEQLLRMLETEGSPLYINDCDN